MAWWEKRVVLRVLAATLAVAAVTWLALWYFIPTPPSKITIAVGIKGGAGEQIAERYRERLARHHVDLNIRLTETSTKNLALLNDRRARVDAAFVFGGSSTTESSEVLSLGRINYAPIWIFYRSQETLDRPTQLKGKRVNISPLIHNIGTKILAAYGINADNTTLSTIGGVGLFDKLKANEFDAYLPPPQQLESPVIQSALRDSDIRLMNLGQAEALARLFRTLTRLELPQGIIDLEKNIPPTDVNLLATTNAIVVRKDLHPELIYLLARTLQEEHSGGGVFERAGEFPTQTDPEFPMAEEARDYYRSGPSFLHRYLPFWMVNLTKRIVALLLTAFAVIIPLFTYGPRLYHWLLRSQLRKLFRQLRSIEAKLRTELTAPEVEALQSDLEEINRAADIFPMRHSDAFFDLIIHIRDTRAELASRLAALSR
jgi:TRAP-type uncharacterized transport system substrate-binding protein